VIASSNPTDEYNEWHTQHCEVRIGVIVAQGVDLEFHEIESIINGESRGSIASKSFFEHVSYHCLLMHMEDSVLSCVHSKRKGLVVWSSGNWRESNCSR